MAPSAIVGPVQNVEELTNKSIDFDEAIGESYYGGRLKFRTKIVWPNVIFFVIIHILGTYGFYLTLKDFVFLNPFPFTYTYIIGFLGGEGVTVGAHRLWCHRSYKARRPLRIMLIIFQTIAGQNCCHTWVKEHRQHHKYSDTDGDPHNASRGLFYSHMGWLMMKKHPENKLKAKTIYMKDVERDPVVVFQKTHFKKMFFLFGIVIPVAIPIFFGETFFRSLMYSFFARYMILLHITWTVNSLAHFFGNKPYDQAIKPTENTFVSFLAYGEGWHNYHHAFPWDYKASEFGKHLNFSRDFIEFCERKGWAYDLKEASKEMVLKKIEKRGDGSHRLGVKTNTQHDTPTEEDLRTGW